MNATLTKNRPQGGFWKTSSSAKKVTDHFLNSRKPLPIRFFWDQMSKLIEKSLLNSEKRKATIFFFNKPEYFWDFCLKYLVFRKGFF